MNLARFLLHYYQIPLVFISIVLYFLLIWLKFNFLALAIILTGIFIGSYNLFREIIKSLLKRQFALDYIAFLTILVSLISKEYVVGAVISLMLSTGRALEAYGTSQAKKTLSLLVNRIPAHVFLIKNGQPGKKEQIERVRPGQQIFIRKGEIVPLDGILVSDSSITDESSITGEPYFIEKLKGDTIRSGTINMGKPIISRVTKAEKDSTYKKIIEMVRRAAEEKSPFVRLADRYSTLFTFITLTIAVFAFFISGSLEGPLAVLVIATPCPLIIATPVALLGGVGKAAKKKIIVKKLAGLEALSKSDTFVFDKTGTITLGKPILRKIEIVDPTYSETKILAIGEALERNSLHPLAKTIMDYANKKGISAPSASDVEEKIGKGISGTIDGKRYTLSKLEDYGQVGMAIGLFQGENRVALFHFEDTIKRESKQIISKLKKMGLDLHIFTGDKRAVAEKIVKELGHDVHIEAELKPEDKQKGIAMLKKQKRIITMVGDGINDAPALAKADVGMVFSNEEQTAASEAADIVLLGGEFSNVRDAIEISKRTISIALQSILWGMGLSVTGMILAALGFIPPLLGAGLQEVIDAAVIVNALRTSR